MSARSLLRRAHLARVDQSDLLSTLFETTRAPQAVCYEVVEEVGEPPVGPDPLEPGSQIIEIQALDRVGLVRPVHEGPSRRHTRT